MNNISIESSRLAETADIDHPAGEYIIAQPGEPIVNITSFTAMDKPTFEQAIYKNWAARFSAEIDAPLDADALRHPATHLLPKEAYSDTRALHIWTIGKRAFVRLDPAYTDALREVLDTLPPGTILTGDVLQAMWGTERIEHRAWDLAHYLYPPNFSPYKPVPPFYVRQLTTQDAASMATMKQICEPDDVDTADIEVNHEIAFGCFADKTKSAQLVAAASGYWLTGFMDIGVLTHPNFRRRGLGKAVVSELCTWCIAHDIITQYRCDVDNVGSHNIAQGLSFTLYFKHESIWLRH